ncbi:MAG: histidine--tRNA ligase [Spirochaetae bacterium HGW-Spirochaetae-1]|jgi:histidyl-tRNA synthetase|nr:MAG: histidine--tRNA ligase [Spirochaetae bacterium HGW-Spirochaetae-1]
MIQKPPGVEDIFPDRIDRWNHITDAARQAFRLHNFREIIIPIMEYTEVFARGLGDETDIVSKEMFTFEDRGGRSLTLRPEGTASVVRAYVENGEYNRLSLNKFFYMGPMFRAERPQRGRLRQFNQFGAEVFGSEDPYYDYEVIAMMDSITKMTGIEDYELLINSIGCPRCREEYLAKLRNYYHDREEQLCKDCRQRLNKNTLRLLDCKVESCREIRSGAPLITDYLDDECRDHHEKLKKYLTSNNIAFREDPFLVRGLDYYIRTTFEFVANRLGGQNAFAAGGRYDQLVEHFDGKHTPAVGFAAGIERMFLLIEEKEILPRGIDAFVIHTSGETLARALEITSMLRKAGLSADIDPNGKAFKGQFKKAERDRAHYCIIIGEDELKNDTCTLKDQASGIQITITLKELMEKMQA